MGPTGRHVIYDRLSHSAHFPNGVSQRLEVVAARLEGVRIGFDPNEFPTEWGGETISV